MPSLTVLHPALIVSHNHRSSVSIIPSAVVPCRLRGVSRSSTSDLIHDERALIPGTVPSWVVWRTPIPIHVLLFSFVITRGASVVSLPQPSFRRSISGLLAALALSSAWGCSGGGPAPTQIFEGGGTIPEIVDQPEPSEAKTARKAPKPARTP
jgi:hypothetical protein